jgi:diguanylate cyclase (GGDEF)-like protein
VSYVGEDGLAAARLIDLEAAELVEDWRQLCRGDPELPAEVEPPAPEPVIAAVADALRRPQPLGWGADPGVAEAMEQFSDRAGPLAVEELVCLREAVSRRLRGRLPDAEVDETRSRLQMTIDRAMACAARRAFEQLERAACMDALTGVLNRRPFERDLRRELGRTARHGGTFSVAILDVDNLKAVNDSEGHAAGDACLREVARALRCSIRGEDSAYRIGGDEFAALLPEATAEQAEIVMGRVASSSSVPFTWGVASCPDDGAALEGLLETADARLYQRRAEARSGG